MPQIPALSTELVERAEDLTDVWDAARADGHICPVEMAGITVLIGEVHTRAGVVDLAQMAGLAVLRCGMASRRPGDLVDQLREAQTA